MTMVIRVVTMTHPFNWWADCLGQVSQVLDVYEPTGFMKVRLHKRTYWDGAIDAYYQFEGWIPPDVVEVVGGRVGE
jgi:hypothetical protein